MKHKRIKALLDHNINLFAYHLPLDIHPTLGNNAQLEKLLNIEVTGPLELDNELSIAIQGQLPTAISGANFTEIISEKLDRACLHIAPPSNKKSKQSLGVPEVDMKWHS